MQPCHGLGGLEGPTQPRVQSGISQFFFRYLGPGTRAACVSLVFLGPTVGARGSGVVQCVQVQVGD